MQVVKKNLTDTKLHLTLTADELVLQEAKKEALEALAKNLKLQGFRPGKAPLSLVEKQVDPAALQSEFLERAMNRLYIAALDQEKLRPVEQPQVKIKKFVPFDTLELEAEVEVVGEVKLPDYKKIKVAKRPVTITAKDVDQVLENLRGRVSEKKDVDRAAKDGDQVFIDFKGVDAKTKEAIAGADGKNYPLTLGSNAFIPGFEPALVGLKANDEKTFTVTFPADYSVKTLQNRKVAFTVNVSKVQEVVEPKLDDAFAAQVGPFKTLADLKIDIKKQLAAEQEQQAERDHADKVLTKITEKTKVAVPKVLVDEQVERILQDQRQSAIYRGQTWEEYLKAEGLKDEASYREKIRPDAELRVKAGLTLAEIGEKEKITITPEEVEVRIQLLKNQYQDPQMQAELAKPEAQRDIASRMLTEKTLSKLTAYATAA
jgi:trigger factor